MESRKIVTNGQCLHGKNRNADIEKNKWTRRGRRGWDEYECHGNIYALPCIGGWSGVPVEHRELRLVLCDDLEWWVEDGGGGGTPGLWKSAPFPTTAPNKNWKQPATHAQVSCRIKKIYHEKTHQIHHICSHFLWESGGRRCPDSTGSEGSCWPLRCPPGLMQTGPWEWKMAYPGCVSAWSGSGSTEGSWERSHLFLPRPPLDNRENTSVTFFPPTKNCGSHGIISMLTSGFVLKI